MSFHHSPQIVKNGLVLCLDAKDLKSYSGSGTTWFDRSGNGNNGTLVNGVSASGGAMVFDGVNDYVNCGTPLIGVGKITVNTWIKITKDLSSQHIVDSAGNSWHLAILDNNKPYFFNGVTFHTETTSLSNQTWYMITGVQGTTLDLYINGRLSQSLPSNINVTTSNVDIGRWQSGTRFYNGNISQVSIYNRALSQAEILQNYNATKSRFQL